MGMNMKLWTRFANTCILLFIVSCITIGGELTDQQRSKLHPFFQSVIAKSFPQLLKTTTARNRIASTVVSQDASLYKAIIYTRDAATLRSMGIQVNSVLPDFVTAQISASDMTRLVALESVTYLDPGNLNYPQLDVSIPETGASLLHSGFINSTSYKGSGAIVLIYDTGIDWKHKDFRKADTTKSRILCIWDQTLTKTGSEVNPSGFSYGVEYTQAQIEDELDGTPAGFVREMDINGHGTHVASTAAGNGLSYNNKYIGMAPEADIIVVKGGNSSFGETEMIDGLTYAQNKAAAYGKPLVVNWSIGVHDGPHDGTRPYEVAVNNFVSNPGRVVCIAAGNNGSDAIHFSGTVASESPSSFSITVPTYTPHSGLDNDYFYFPIWCRDGLAVDVTVLSPTGVSYTRTAGLVGIGIAPSTVDGTIEVSNLISSMNNNREIEVYVHDVDANVPKSGTWTITLTMTSGSVVYDTWLEYSDLGGSNATLPAGNTNETVGMPGTASGAITVGAYASKWYWYSYNNTGPWNYGTDRTDNIATFSSIGPTADGRQKPDIAAPGQIIAAALSSGVDITGKATYIVTGQKHQIMQGTSMACPHVTGGTALLLGANPSLTAAQIKMLYTSTANSDSYAIGLPNYIWGYGKCDVLEAMAKSIAADVTVTRTTLAYDGTASSTYLDVTGTTKIAVRFTPTTTGKLTGIQVYISSLPSPIIGSGPLVCEVYTDNAGLPGTKIGNSVNQPFTLLSPYTNNYIQMLSANATVTAGTDYQIVLSVANSSDDVKVLAEGVTGTHSSVFNGSSWTAQTAFNLRIRSIVTSTTGIFPVELVSLSATTKGRNVSLHWLTITEVNNFGFDVERRQSGINLQWAKVGFMPGYGTSNISHDYFFIDSSFSIGNFVYRLKQIDNDGVWKYSNSIEVSNDIPLTFALSQNYPNPFNPSTTIKYTIPAVSNVTLKIFNLLGQVVTTLVDERQEANTYVKEFDASKLSSGIYFYQISAGSFNATKKMILLK